MSDRARAHASPLIAVIALATVGCGAATPEPSASTATGFVVVTADSVEPHATLFNSEDRARVVASDGSILADWAIASRPGPVPVPATTLRLETFTLFFSDWIQCSPDPAAPGTEHCAAPTLGPAQICTLEIEVRAGETVETAFRADGSGGCALVVTPAAVAT